MASDHFKMKKHNMFRGNLTGRKFERWTVLFRSFEKHKDGGLHWRCKCDCGIERDVTQRTLLDGSSRSCGCLKRDSIVTHGFTSRKSNRHPIYATWMSMRTRCSSPNATAYECYGGRGISVCERWNNSFEKFFEDMGPSWFFGATIERIDNNGNYCPENCKWATRKQQARNRRTNRILEVGGMIMSVCEWAELFNINATTIHTRLLSGMSPSDAVIKPILK